MTSPGGTTAASSGNGLAGEVHTLERAIFEVKRVIVGQDQLVERILVGLLAKGHVLLEGVPGVAKTLAVETFAKVVGGTSLFRLYEVDNAAKWQERLARGHVWSRIFPYSKTWLRLGLPAPDRWSQLEATL